MLSAPMPRVLLLSLLLLGAAPLAARELHWDSIDVKARLDDRGTLHVVERQRFVFTGDWNGGERRFRVGDGHDFRFLGIRQIDERGGSLPLILGDLTAVNEYRLAGTTLRWRSRLPTDPEFENTVLIYELAYELSNILIAFGAAREKRYLLNHDFAFPDRPGRIGRFTLVLELDSSWKGIEPQHILMKASDLLPGESVIVRRELTYSGVSAPGAAFRATAPLARRATIALVVAGVPLIFIFFWRGEHARGRFVQVREPIDEQWIERHILADLPEVVGYMYDHQSGAPEVAAILARLVQKGYITSNVKPRRLREPLLRMTLHARGRDLALQEQQLVQMFFFNGAYETDTDRVRKHYKKKGFDPGGRIEGSLVAQAARNPDWIDDAPRSGVREQRRTLIGAFALLIVGLFFGFYSVWLMIYMAVLGGIACGVGRLLASRSADKMRWLPLWWLAASAPTLLVAWLLITIARREWSEVRELPLLIAAIFLLTVYWFVLRGGVTKQSKQKMLLRARIRAARQWFARQLRLRQPELRDEWAPYLLALGLGRNVDRWFSTFGAELAGATSASASSFGSSAGSSAHSEGSSVSKWSGGGGAFGGAGATGSWAAAAASLASGQSAPMETSGGGGSGGGSSSSGGDSGSSSGGGGGGGW
jgi:uncharacterized membrane protein YgcG